MPTPKAQIPNEPVSAQDIQDVKASGVAINTMADKFKHFMEKGEKKPAIPVEATPAPSTAPAPAPAPTPVKVDPKDKPLVPEFKTPTPPPAQPEPPPAPVKEKTKIPSEHFKQLESDRDTWRTKASEYEKQLADFKAQMEQVKNTPPAPPPDYEVLKSELAKHQELVSQIALERSPQFKAAFDDKISESIRDAQDVVGKDKAEVLGQILSMPAGESRDEELKSFASELDEFEAGGLREQYFKIKKLQREREHELMNHKENLKKIKDYEQVKATEDRAMRNETRKKLAEAEMAEASQFYPEFREVEGNSEHNARVSESRQMVKDFLSNDLSDKEMARLMVYAVKGYRSTETDVLKDALIAKLKSQLTDLASTSPAVDSGTPSKHISANSRPGQPDIASVAARFKKAMEHGVPDRGQ